MAYLDTKKSALSPKEQAYKQLSALYFVEVISKNFTCVYLITKILPKQASLLAEEEGGTGGEVEDIEAEL